LKFPRLSGHPTAASTIRSWGTTVAGGEESTPRAGAQESRPPLACSVRL